MKKYTILMAALLLLTMPMKANPVDAKTAQKVAETFMQAQTGTKATLQRIDYADQSAFPNFYVFGTESSFVIISADDCVEPVLGYSTENPFGTEKMPENLFWWLKGYDEQIADAAKSGQKATSEVAQQWKDLSSGNTSKAQSEVIVGPLIQTKWKQQSPYNTLCPGGNSTGCVATAMAQIMRYWEYPTTGFGSHSYTPLAHPEYGEQTANFGETTYEWANMLSSYSDGYSEAQANAIATLMYHCGVSVNMNYGEDGTASGAVTSNVVYALQIFFNYSQTAQYISRSSIVNEAGQEDLEQWKNMLKAELDAYPPRPLQYRGKGHSFICDGYNSDDKFHFNWGWGNSTDGYYLVNNLNSVNPNYNKDQAAIFGIQPITYDAQPSGLVASVSNLNVSLTWNEVGNASSYNVYRDYTLIGNTGTNTSTFTDNNAPIGNHTYFVRSVDNEGNVSLPSNIANANVKYNYSLENLMIEHLELSYQDGNATLQWTAPIKLQHLDFYSLEESSGPAIVGENEKFYWGTRFPSSMVASGTSITSVSTYFYAPGTYTAYVYQCSGENPSGTPTSISGTYTKGWHNIPIGPIAYIDGKDIWVIFKSTVFTRPTVLIGQNVNEGNYYSFSGEAWYHVSGYSFFISASLTDSNFTYNIYDNDVCVAQNLNTPIHTLSNISQNTAHQYTVKTELGNEETEASNMVGVTVGTASLTSLELGDNDNMTIAENSTLTVGSLTNDNPANLIIENGGQLITSSTNVHATVKKSIEHYTVAQNQGEDITDGWYFIASPIAGEIEPDANNGLAYGDYDLYYYDEAAHYWRNHKESEHSEYSGFSLNSGKGYLYANASDVQLSFAGLLSTVGTVDLDFNTNEEAVLAGWNLVGNPFTYNAYIGQAYYIHNGTSVEAKTAADPIAPCTGVLVQATESDQTVTFTQTAPNESKGDLQMTVAQQVINRDGTSTPSTGSGTRSVSVDNAIVSFNKDNQLGKFYFGEKKANLYIPQDGKEYAVASNNGQAEMPLNFKAHENGTYTLNIEANDMDLEYLHLIDNLTGADVNLLETPSYTFEAKTNDYVSRFRLVFSDAGDAGSDNLPFAFISNGQLQIFNQGEAHLQIVDIMGHILSSESIHGDYDKPLDLSAGVYIMRLSNAQTTRTQKIVVQ